MHKLNIDEIKKDFPILNQKINGNRLVYLDNGATTQKPIPVIETIYNYNTKSHGNPTGEPSTKY